MNYRFAYSIGFHPWEEAAKDPPFSKKISEMFDREESGREPPFGPALDIGRGYRLAQTDGAPVEARRALVSAAQGRCLRRATGKPVRWEAGG
jgi:hypothetical protein